MHWLEEFVGDSRYAIRSLFRSPAFTATAILTIALGIGVNTAVFSVIHAVLLDPLPFRDPERLVHIAETHPDFPSFQVAAPDVVDWQRLATSFDGISAYTFQAVNVWTILGDGEPEQVHVVQASQGLFGMLGVRPLLGRTYTEAEEVQKVPVVVISESLWRRKYAANPAIIGRKIRLVGWPVTVIGVVAARHAEPVWADVWMPLTFLDRALTESRRFRALEVVARLKPGVPIERAQVEMMGIASNLAKSYPDSNGRVGVSVIPLSSWMTGEVKPELLIAWAAVSLVLLLACANVAHLVLVRTAHRSRELAVRAALGAGSGRLIRFLMVENLAVASAGGLLGAFLAWVSLPVLLRLAANEIPRLDSVSLSSPALIFGGCATLLCAIIFGLPALLRSSKLELHHVIKQSGGFSAGHRRSLFGAFIIAAEVALAFMVVAGAGLLYRSFALLLDEKMGFDSHGVLAVDVSLDLAGNQAAKVFEQRVGPALRALPGVTDVAAANCGPMMLPRTGTSRYSTRFGIEGRTFPPGSFPFAQYRWTTPEYFRTLNIPLRRGRLFTARDIGKKGYVINEALARRFFPDSDPIGQRILYGVNGPNPESIQIIGVVGDTRDLGLDIEPSPTLYSLGVSGRSMLLIRSGVEPASLIPAVRRLLRASNPNAPITRIAPLDEIVKSSLAPRRFALELLLVFAILAAVLTAVGVYGVVGYALSQRTREFAIRFALGAERGQVRHLVLCDFGVPAFVGLLAGTWLAYLCAQALRSQLYKLSPADPVVLGLSAVGLLTLVLVSALRPAAKAAAISPTGLLRD